MTSMLLVRLRFSLLRLGWPGFAGVLLIFASLGMAHWSADQAREQIVALRSAQADERKREAHRPDPVADQAKRLAEFHGQLPDAAAALEAVQHLHRSAAEHGVTLATGEYRLTREGGTRLQRYQITLPAEGTYPAIRAWIADVLNEMPSMAMEELSLSRKTVNEARVEARVRWTFYLRMR